MAPDCPATHRHAIAHLTSQLSSLSPSTRVRGSDTLLLVYEPTSRVALSPSESDRLFGTAERRSYATRDAIFYEGDTPNALHYIISGRVSATVTSKDGKQLTFDIMGSGEIFGEIGVLATEPERERSATIRALEPTVTRALRQAEFERRRREDRAVDDLLVRILRHRVLRLSAQLRDALYLPAEQRVLRRLIDLEQVWKDARGKTVIRVTQDELAELAGTARATVNGILQQEGQRGNIEVRPPRRIAILNLEALKRQADP